MSLSILGHRSKSFEQFIAAILKRCKQKLIEKKLIDDDYDIGTLYPVQTKNMEEVTFDKTFGRKETVGLKSFKGFCVGSNICLKINRESKRLNLTFYVKEVYPVQDSDTDL